MNRPLQCNKPSKTLAQSEEIPMNDVPSGPRRVVLATGNAGKVRELAACLADLGYEVLPQSHFGVPEAEETGLSADHWLPLFADVQTCPCVASSAAGASIAPLQSSKPSWEAPRRTRPARWARSVRETLVLCARGRRCSPAGSAW